MLTLHVQHLFLSVKKMQILQILNMYRNGKTSLMCVSKMSVNHISVVDVTFFQFPCFRLEYITCEVWSHLCLWVLIVSLFLSSTDYTCQKIYDSWKKLNNHGGKVGRMWICSIAIFSTRICLNNITSSLCYEI